jgi:glucosamine kinase
MRVELRGLPNVPEGAATTFSHASKWMSKYDSSDHARFYIGVDGGGTCCRARIEDAEGRLLGQGAAGPAATRIGADRSMQEVRTASMAAAADAGLLPIALAHTSAGVGLAGSDRKGIREALLSFPHPFRKVVYATDAKVACLGAHSGRDGGIVVLGTGSVGFARVKGREIRIGGYGFPISDEGSGADLRLQAVRLALRAHDGRAIPTPFLLEVMERLGPDAFTLVAWAEQATATEYASLAPVALSYAEAGDPFAEEIVAEGARHVDVLIRSLAECGVPRISLLGGPASRLVQWLSPDVLQFLSPPEGDAVAGGLLFGPSRRTRTNRAEAEGAQIC